MTSPGVDLVAGEPTVRPCVFVVGAGRSGTSTVSMMLQRLGFVVPPPEVPPDETNPRGFAESQWTVDFHDALLDEAVVQQSDSRPDASRRAMEVVTDAHVEMARAWLAEHDGGRGLLVKDPRTASFLPLWQEAVRGTGMRPVYVTMLRAPHEVAMSHSTYYAEEQGPTQFLAAWASSMLTAERLTRGEERAFVLFDELLAGPAEALAGLVSRLPGLDPTGIDPGEIDDAAGIVDPRLRRVTPSWDEVPAPEEATRIIREVWSALCREASGVSAAAELDDLADRWESFYSLAEALVSSSTLASVVRSRRAAVSLQETARRLPGQLWARVRTRGRHVRTAR